MRPSFRNDRPTGFLAIAIFFFFGAAMAMYAAITLFFPKTFLDRGWTLNPSAHEQLGRVGRMIGLPFVVLAVALLLAGLGWLKRRYWGWLLGFSIIAFNLAVDVFNSIRGKWFKGVVGITIAGLLLAYMLSIRMRRFFLRG